jgi:hypothetical protein
MSLRNALYLVKGVGRLFQVIACPEDEFYRCARNVLDPEN